MEIFLIDIPRRTMAVLVNTQGSLARRKLMGLSCWPSFRSTTTIFFP